MDLSWASPVGVGAFFAGCGVFFWGLFHGVEALARSKQYKEPNGSERRVS